MKHEVEILCGPAAAGKTSRLLGIYRDALQAAMKSRALGQALWLSPTERARRQVLRGLVESPGACFAPNVLTFDSFAERILAAEGGAVRPLSAIARRMLASAVIDEARRSGTIEYFQPIAHTSGFLDLVLSFFSELKREELWPADFALIAEKRCSRKDRELAALYQTYQQRLVDAQLYDAEGRFWSARSILASDGGPFRDLSLVIVDGFADFTHTQYEILALLAQRTPRMLVSLQLDDSDERTDLFTKSVAALDAIRELIDPKSITTPIPLPRSRHPVPALRHIAHALFGNPRKIVPSDEGTGVEILAAAGPAGEVRMVAEGVKGLLLRDAKPDQIVVGVRGLEEYADLIGGAFASASIPYGCDVRPPLSRAPIVKAVCAMLENEREDWPFARLSALLRSSYFRPNWKRMADPSSRAAAVDLLRDVGLVEGRARILAAAARRAQSAKPEERVAAVRSSELLSRLSAATNRLRETLPFEQWVERLIGVCDELGISPRPKLPSAPIDELDRRDTEHWKCLKETLYDAADILGQVGDRQELALDEFFDVLTDLLHAQSLPAPPILPGRVLIVEAADVRNLDVPHLFLVGLTESSFPQRKQDDCVSSQAERRQLARSRKSGQKRSTHQQDEMQLFYSIVTRARASLTLSYPALSGSGQPLFPSPYLAAIRELFKPAAIRVTQRNDLDPVPGAEGALTAADLRLLAADQIRAGDAGFLRFLFERPETAAMARTVLASADMAAARFESTGFTPYEGMLTRGATLAALANLFSPQHEFSATALESYAVCPFRYLLADLVRAKPPMDPGDKPLALIRGVLLHSLLKQLHRKAGEEGGELDLAAGFRALVDEVLPTEAAEGVDKVLLHIERQFFTDLADVYTEQWKAYCEKHKTAWESPPSPAHLEIAFGKAPDDGEDRAALRLPAIEVGKGKTKIKVGGRIDRVDVGRASGRPVFNVIDYKTTFAPSFKIDQVREGTALQLAIYMLVVARHDLAGEGAEAFQIAYWTLTREGFLPGLKGGQPASNRLGTEAVAEIDKIVNELLPRMATKMRQGEFPVRNDDQDCAGRCDYHTVCRVNQVRSVAEDRAKEWRLAAE